MGATTWSPLASGLLTGRYNDGVSEDGRFGALGPHLRRAIVGGEGERRLERARRFTGVAAELGSAPAPLAIAWCLRNPHVSSVILGASRVEQLLQNLGALELAERIDESGWQRVRAAAG